MLKDNIALSEHMLSDNIIIFFMKTARLRNCDNFFLCSVANSRQKPTKNFGRTEYLLRGSIIYISKWTQV
jgi:hypothetical protein